jgi:ketosteroid isomerase-like protein
MSQESTTHDVVALARRSVESANSRDYDAMMRFWAPNGVWDLSPMGLGTYGGEAAIRAFFEDWIVAYDDFQIDAERVNDLGNGVVFAVLVQTARPAGSIGWVQIRYAAVSIWADGLCERSTNYTDIDEARAAAERLAQERG